MNFEVGDSVILRRGYRDISLEEIYNRYPEFKNPVKIDQIFEEKSQLFGNFAESDFPMLCFIFGGRSVYGSSHCFDLCKVGVESKICCCDLRDLMIRGCKCGGK